MTYLGPLDRAGVRAALEASAVVLAASTWHDVLPTVIIEALASGRPVLGTALGGIPYLVGADTPREPAGTGPAAVASAVAGGGGSPMPVGIVVTGTAGWVVPPEPAALAAALPVARAGAAALAPAGPARYERTFHPDVVTKRLLDIYAGLARTPTRLTRPSASGAPELPRLRPPPAAPGGIGCPGSGRGSAQGGAGGEGDAGQQEAAVDDGERDHHPERQRGGEGQHQAGHEDHRAVVADQLRPGVPAARSR